VGDDSTKNLLHESDKGVDPSVFKLGGLFRELSTPAERQWTIRRQPLFDTEWLDRGMNDVEFFVNPTTFRSEGRNFGTLGKRWGKHTNLVARNGLLAKGQRFHLERVVMYPTLEDVRGSTEGYLLEVERFRAGASYAIMQGNTLKWGGPLSDLLSCCSNPSAPKDGDFDPSEAPGLEYRRGIDVRVDGKPHCLDEQEEFRIRVSGPAVRGEVGLRCYLVGTQFNAICQYGGVR
jgi:hypothetical protein